jgi:hypothetical protein
MRERYYAVLDKKKEVHTMKKAAKKLFVPVVALAHAL